MPQQLNETDEQYHDRLCAMGEDEVDPDDAVLRTQLRVERKKVADAARKAAEELAEKKREAAEKEERKRQRKVEKEKQKEKRVQADVGDDDEGQSNAPPQKKKKSVVGEEFPNKCTSCAKKEVPCLRPAAGKGHACKACSTGKIKCSHHGGDSGSGSGSGITSDLVEAFDELRGALEERWEGEMEQHAESRADMRKSVQKLEKAIGGLTAEVRGLAETVKDFKLLANSVRDIGRLGAAFVKVHHPEVVEHLLSGADGAAGGNEGGGESA
ncbi:hypothetical protein B0H19DRAFT_1086062 [Mycena capillaripes]|nr:hypothetical protein B0H19DRAFT_1086062 [Mycena capillaripes]